jgi:hypothetical protein
MQPLPGSSSTLQTNARAPRTAAKSHLYDGIWRIFVPVDVIAAALVVAFGIFRGWDSAREYLEGLAFVGQALIVLAVLVLAAGLYLRWRGGYHDWQLASQSEDRHPFSRRPDLGMRRLSAALNHAAATIYLLPVIALIFI